MLLELLGGLDWVPVSAGLWDWLVEWHDYIGDAKNAWARSLTEGEAKLVVFSVIAFFAGSAGFYLWLECDWPFWIAMVVGPIAFAWLVVQAFLLFLFMVFIGIVIAMLFSG